MVRTAGVPEEYNEIFQRAEKLVGSYFGRLQREPEEGRIEIDGQRYVLVRAPSLSVDFYDLMESLYQGRTDRAHAVGRNLLFHLAHFLGRSDARAFHDKLGLDNPMAKLSAGPVHFAHAGWAYVDILPESNPEPSEEYVLVYDHPYSFESDSWIRAERRAPCPICFMNSGYSAGWCEESFGLPLAATEILCAAKGDPICRFIMAPPQRLEGRVADYLEKHPDIAAKVTSYEVPGEFEQRELVERLQLSESRYRQLFDASTDAIVIIEGGRINHVNRRAVDLFGEPRQSLRGRHFSSLCSTPSLSETAPPPDLEEAMGRALTEGPQELFIRLQSARRKPITAEVSLTRIEGTEKSLLAVIRDVTERERLADELRQLQKMEAVGTLAGGIAHDFNNILTGASGNLGQLRKVLPEGSTGEQQWLGDAQVALDRAAAVVSQLLTLTSTSQKPWEVVDLRQMADSAVVSAREGGLEPSIAVIASHEADCQVEGAREELRQALDNLLSNARHAVLARSDREPAGSEFEPRITVETRAVTDPERPDGSLEMGTFARLTVADNGIGMDEETARRCFEPFFTAKPVGEGTGMGLAALFGVVQQHRGWVALETSPDSGTRLSVFLPETERTGTEPRREMPAYEDPPHGVETVLFVDDEAPLRKLASFVFGGLGYTLVPASGGAEALQAIEERSVDLVVLDLTMPRMSGGDVLDRIRRIRPELPVVLSSGFSVDFDASDLERRGAAAFVAKPYDMDDLARLMRDILDGRHPPRAEGDA